MRTSLIVIAIVLASPTTNAAPNGFFIGAGLLGQHIMSVSGDNTGASGTMGGTYPQLALGVSVPAAFIGGAWSFMPSLAYTMPGRLLNDDSGRVNIWTLALPFAGTISFFDFKIGLGMMFYQYRGAGGQSTLSDSPDSSSTATYYRPRDSVTSKTFLTDLGAGIDFGGGVRFDLDVYINGILSLKRDFSLAAQLSYFFN